MKRMICLICILMPLALFAQSAPGLESGVFRLEKGMFDSHQLMIGRKIPPAEVIGHYYLDTSWHQGTFRMKEGRTSAEYPLRYDIENALLEVRWQGQVKVVGEEYLDSFRWYEGTKKQARIFNNGRAFSLDQSTISGFLELVYAGKDSLVLSYDAYMKQPDYVVGLDMGSRHPEIIKTRKIYIVTDGALHAINKRKDFFDYASGLSKRVLKQKLKTERLSIKDPHDLATLMQYYETYQDEQP
jgi:hypothetical protein